MDPLDHLRFSESAKLHIRGTYKRPNSLATVLPEALMHHGCVGKPFGSIDFTLDANTLGWPAPFNFKLQAKTKATLGNLAIWDLGQAVGMDFVAPNGANVRVDSVEATFDGLIVDRGTYQSAAGRW